MLRTFEVVFHEWQKINPGCLCLPWTGARFCALLPATDAGVKLGVADAEICVKLAGHRAETPQEGTKVSFGNGTFGRWDGWWWIFLADVCDLKRSAYVYHWYPCAMFGILKQHPCNRCDWSCRFCLDQSPTRQRLTVEFCPVKMSREVAWVAKVAKMCSQPSSVPLSFQDVTEQYYSWYMLIHHTSVFGGWKLRYSTLEIDSRYLLPEMEKLAEAA